MITLALDASTYTGTVAVIRDGVVASSVRVPMRGEHEERLMPAVAEALARSGVSRCDRVVCGGGPGSFTSLRISASIAKGLATGWNRPLYAVSSLALIAAGAEPALRPGRYLTALDALRGEAYVALCEVGEDSSVDVVEAPRLIPHDGVAVLAESLNAIVIGPGQKQNISPDARGVANLERSLAESGPVDLRSWEPAYGRLAEAQVKWEAAHGRPLPNL